MHRSANRMLMVRIILFCRHNIALRKVSSSYSLLIIPEAKGRTLVGTHGLDRRRRRYYVAGWMEILKQAKASRRVGLRN